MTGPDRATPRTQIRQRLSGHSNVSMPKFGTTSERALLDEDVFISMLYVERRRAERARKRFVLVLIDLDELLGIHQRNGDSFGRALLETTRETDILGWYLQSSMVGVIGTELGTASDEAIKGKFREKIHKVLEQTLGPETGHSIFVSFHFFPEESCKEGGDHSASITLYSELKNKTRHIALP